MIKNESSGIYLQELCKISYQFLDEVLDSKKLGLDAQTNFEKLHSLYQNTDNFNKFTTSKAVKISSPIIKSLQESILEGTHTFEVKGGKHLSNYELETLTERGFVGSYTMDLSEKIKVDAINEIQDFFRDENGPRRTVDVQWFVPSVFQLVYKNIDLIAAQSASIFNTNPDNIIISIQAFSVGPQRATFLHNDYSSSLYASKIEFINFHLDLTKVDNRSNQFILFPGTHKEIEYPYYAFQQLVHNEIPINISKSLQALAIWDSMPFVNVTRSEGKIVQSSFGQYSLDDSVYGYYPIYKRCIEQPNDIKAHHVHTDPGQYIILIPSILHGSTNHPTETNRISLVVRATKISHESVFTLNILESDLLKMFAGEEIEKLKDSCENIGDVIKHLPHQEKLSVEEIKTILFDDANIPDSTKMSLQLALRNNTTLPFVSISKLVELNCRAGFFIGDACNHSQENTELLGIIDDEL
ncbi:MAG: hypothetical protein RLN62_02485 [Rickettsiales bacterium]